MVEHTRPMSNQGMYLRSAMIMTMAMPAWTAAQINIPFPDSAATWVNVYEYMIAPPPLPVFEVQSTSNFCMDGSDTLYDNLSYSKLEHCSGGYVGGIRQDTGAVFFLPADSTLEFLLNDFGVAVGDTVRGIYVNQALCTGISGFGAPELMDAVVDQIDTLLDLSYRRRIWMDAVGFGYSTMWIEGIGSESGLFSFSASNVSGFYHYLHCMSHTDTTWYGPAWPTPTPGNCVPWYLAMGEVTKDTRGNAWPNPTTGGVSIAADRGTDLLMVVDAFGRTVPAPVTYEMGRVLVDLRAQPSGVYLVLCAENVHRVMKE